MASLLAHDRPAVSVIVPAYNQSRYLAAAIESALAQTWEDLEVLVVDDGSTDTTADVAAGIQDRRLRYIYQENRGLSAARNTGIRHARGTHLTFLDSDDLFLPSKLEVLLAALRHDPTLGLVAGEAMLIDEDGHELGEVFDRGLPEDPADLLLGNPLHVGSVLLRREWQERAGWFDERLRSYEDWDMWLRLAQVGCPMASVARPVSRYRFHGAQMTRISAQMTQATFAVLEKVYADPALPHSWRTRQDQAYGRAFLRAAAQAYTARDFTQAQAHLRSAVARCPELRANDAEPLARAAAAWANHAKTREPLGFLEGVYANLPDELPELRRRRRRDLAREALQLAHAAHRQQDHSRARSRLWQAAGYDPRVLLDRGVLSMLVHRTPTRRADDPRH